MSFASNAPDVDRLLRQLSGLAAKDLKRVDPLLLDELLEASIADVELKAHTAFDGTISAPPTESSVYDGNGGTTLMLRRWPVTSVIDFRVETPVLGYVRVYTPDEIKIYPTQGIVEIFTYKMLAQTVTSNRLDPQAWAVILPPLPQAVKVTYTYGFPQFDPDANSGAGATSLDGGVTSVSGDTRDRAMTAKLKQLQQAAICDAAASYLAQVAGLGVGLLQSVSFDGFSKSMNPQAYGPQVQALIQRRDELMERRKRAYLATGGA